MLNIIFKKIFLVTCILSFGLFSVFAEEGEGLRVNLHMGLDVLNMTFRSFEHSEFRPAFAQNHSEIQYLISNWNFDKDARASISYDADNYGGSFAFQPQIVSGSWSFGARMKGWAQFSFLRLTIGNDIETNYADWQGSEEALLFFNGNKWTNPDNITDSSGILAEVFFNQFTLAMSAGDFMSKWIPTSRIQNGEKWDNEYRDTYNIDFRYGARIGYGLGEAGKLNLSYKLTHKSVADSFGLLGGDSSRLEPQTADAKVTDHLFGLFGSFYFGDFGFTAAYQGSMTSYISEYPIMVANEIKTFETAIPLLFVNGLNFNALWKINERLAFHTDNAFSFWQDKNYNVFLTRQNNMDLNLLHKNEAALYAVVNNIAIRNSIGLKYDLTESLEGNVYVRNTVQYNNASGRVAYKEGMSNEYSFIRNNTILRFGMKYKFSPTASVFAQLELGNNLTSRSKDLNSQTQNFFMTRVGDITNVREQNPLSTRDNEFVVRIPIGFTLQMR